MKEITLNKTSSELQLIEKLKRIIEEEIIPNPLYLGLIRLVKYVVKRVSEEDYDATLALTGDEGVGKSSLAFWVTVLFYYYMGRIDEFKLDVNCVFKPNIHELLEVLDGFEKQTGIWMDEAVDLLYKSDALTREAKAIVKEFTKDRSKNRLKLLLIPRITDLVENIRNHRILLNIYCYEKSYATILRKYKSVAAKDPWNLKEGEDKLKDFRFDRKMRARFYSRGKFKFSYGIKLAYYKNFSGFIRWPKMPEPWWSTYNGLKDTNNSNTNKEVRELIGVRKQKRDNALYSVVNELHVLGYSQRKICKIVKVDQRTVSEWLTKASALVENK